MVWTWQARMLTDVLTDVLTDADGCSDVWPLCWRRFGRVVEADGRGFGRVDR